MLQHELALAGGAVSSSHVGLLPLKENGKGTFLIVDTLNPMSILLVNMLGNTWSIISASIRKCGFIFLYLNLGNMAEKRCALTHFFFPPFLKAQL